MLMIYNNNAGWQAMTERINSRFLWEVTMQPVDDTANDWLLAAEELMLSQCAQAAIT